MTDKILLVEHERKWRQLFEAELQEAGYDVLTATDGNEALKQLYLNPVDLIILELKLPDGGGLDYLQSFMQIRREAKVVINTAYPSYKLDFQSWAADAFLTKSSDTNELKDTIDGLLHARRN